MLVNANLSIFHLHYLCKLKGMYNNGDSIQSTFNSFLQINRKISEVFILKRFSINHSKHRTVIRLSLCVIH